MTEKLSPYGISEAMGESAPEGAVEQLLHTAKRYEVAQKEIQTATARKKETTEQLTVLLSQMRAFLALYGIVGETDVTAGLHRLETETEEYRGLCEKIAQTDTKRREKQAEVAELRKTVLLTLVRFDAARDIAEEATDMTASIAALVSETSQYRALKASIERRQQ